MKVTRYDYPVQGQQGAYNNDNITLCYDEPPSDEPPYNEPTFKHEPRYNDLEYQEDDIMAAPQYNFPPPPAPPTANGYQQHAQYPYQQPPQYQPAQRGGAPFRGGRGGYSAPTHTQHGYTGPSQNQAPVNAPYDPRNPAPYIGPQPPNQHAGQHGHQAAQQPQWQQHQQHQQQRPPQQGPPHVPQQMHQPHHAAPLSSQNYHPNYAPQAYQPPQYGQQQPQYQHTTQAPYGQHIPASPQPPQGGQHQWAPPQHNQPQFANRGRGRGGFNTGRGGYEAPLVMGPPIRMGFDKASGNAMPQASAASTPPFAVHTSPAAPFTSPYQSYTPNFSHGGVRPPFDSQSFQSGSFRGRGNHNSNFKGRGRGDFQSQRGNNRRFSNQQTAEVHQKAAGADQNAKQKNKKKRRVVNTLGLTPNGAEHEESEEEVDDVDEEARLVTLLGADAPQLPTDLKDWLAKRKARFPTKARREAAAEEERKRHEEAQKGQKEQEEKKPKTEPETELEKQQRKAEKLRQELEKAERRIQESLSGGGKRKREDGDEGDDHESDSSSSSEPEAASSRLGGPMRVPPPAKAQLQRHCKYFSTGGTCGKKGKCRFIHDSDVRNKALRDKEANGGKMTLAHRLILNDTAKDDLTILKALKYLHEKGLMTDGTSPEQPARADQDGEVQHDGLEHYGDESQYGEV